MFATTYPVHPSLIFAGKAGSLESCKVIHSGRLLALPKNIRLGRKGMEVAKTLAYYSTATITIVKSFIVQVLGRQVGVHI